MSVTIDECIKACLADAELLREFDRLSGTGLSARGIDAEIDRATGRREADLLLFIAFVRECIWERLQ